MHPIKHFMVITKHRHQVIKHCAKCGIFWQGLKHDLSKYSPTEFIPGAKYFLGTRSPNEGERQDKGYSLAWIHHQGRNKHHFEYWTDIDLETNKYVPIEMPDRYIAESICDRIAASEIYNKKNFKPQMVLDYFHNEKGQDLHPNTYKKIETLLELYVANGKKYIFKYLKKNMRKKK